LEFILYLFACKLLLLAFPLSDKKMIEDATILNELLEETITLSIEDGSTTKSLTSFTDFIMEMLPPNVLSELETIAGGPSFIEDIWEERFAPKMTMSSAATSNEDMDEDVEFIGEKDCLICERSGLRLTRHHVYPREVHHQLLKKWKTTKAHADVDLNETIIICRMCHNAVHRLFTNQQLAASYHSLDALLTDERFVKYAKWAARLPVGRFGAM
jgi:hypothetical protein